MRRSAMIWAGLTAALITPVIAAAFSPYLQWRQPVYIVAGFAGIVGLALMVLQPLLAAQLLPGLSPLQARRAHRWIGGSLIAAVAVHVAGLWITSPPDVIDALTFTSPTPFSFWGVMAMWVLFATGALAALRRRLQLRVPIWQRWHMGLAIMAVSGTIVHALLIEGTMETISKIALCALALIVTAKAVINLRLWKPRTRN